jgi:hypothetical protein
MNASSKPKTSRPALPEPVVFTLTVALQQACILQPALTVQALALLIFLRFNPRLEVGLKNNMKSEQSNTHF